MWPVGQVVKTPPFHGGNRGSTPLRVTTWRHSSAGRASVSHAGGRRFEFCCLHHAENAGNVSFRRFFIFRRICPGKARSGLLKFLCTPLRNHFYTGSLCSSAGGRGSSCYPSHRISLSLHKFTAKDTAYVPAFDFPAQVPRIPLNWLHAQNLSPWFLRTGSAMPASPHLIGDAGRQCRI